MAKSHVKRLEKLQAALEAVRPEDTMAEAGRKVLLSEFMRMLQHEAGSRTGEDIEDVHQMRVATRRMRSTFRLLKPYFKAKHIRPFTRDLRRVAWALGDVRDLDVMIDDLMRFGEELPKADQEALAAVVADLDARRASARGELVALLDSKAYRRFIKAFSEFLTAAPDTAPSPTDSVVPVQVRHILPTMIYDRLGAVRAYETVLAHAEPVTLHALRIEFKRLRYAVSLFQGILGAQIDDFITDLKTIQDHLGRLNDITTAHAFLDDYLADDNTPQAGVLKAYITSLEAERPLLQEKFPEIWERFNTRKVQQKLSSAVLALR